jgi:predicted transposase YbfD/YdcC
MDHAGSVLAQRQVADKSNEIPAFAPLLDPLDLEHTLITADALHTRHAHGAYLRERGAHYLAVVKKNHPGLHDRISRLPWRDITLDHYDRTRAHHRNEIRRLEAAMFDHIDYPGARQAPQVVRWRQEKTKDKLTIERVYLITSLHPGEATGAQLAAWIRGHWGIENPLHHVPGPSARTTPRSAPGICPAPWPACAAHQHRRRPTPHRPRLPTTPDSPRTHLTNPDTRSLLNDPGPWPGRAVALRTLLLRKADLTGAELSHVDLTGARLSRANLTGAKLDGARLDGVRGLPPSFRLAS